MTRMIALVYNGWNLFVRLAIPEKHHEAITSRPLLLSRVGRLTEHSRQKRLVITSTHGNISKLPNVYQRLVQFFSELKANAPQLNSTECRERILVKAMEKYQVKVTSGNPIVLPAPT